MIWRVLKLSLLALVLGVVALGVASLVRSFLSKGVPPAAAATVGPSMKSIPPPALEALRRTLHEVEKLIPAPEKPYALQPEETKSQVDPTAPWDTRAKTWARPARATAEYSYAVPDDAPGVSPELRELLGPIEVGIELNGETRFADLASEGGPPTLFPVKDATAVEVTAIAPGAVQGRVAAMTPRQAEYKITALTVFIGDPAAESNIRSAVRNRTPLKAATSRTSDPAELHFIALRIHGPEKPVEELAKRLPASALRRLLHR